MSVTCRRATASDRAAMKALWRLSFPEDADEDIELFFKTFQPAATAYVLCEADVVCSMLFLLPTAVQDGEYRFAAGYIYAGATHPDARGKGYYRRLLDFVTQTAKQEGTAALLLRPATASLADSYRRMGFSVPLYGNAHPRGDADVPMTVDAGAYGMIRRDRLRGQAFVDWDDRTIAYALSWCNAGADKTAAMLYDTETVWESLPVKMQTETALLMPLTEIFRTTTPIWFGYGLE